MHLPHHYSVQVQLRLEGGIWEPGEGHPDPLLPATERHEDPLNHSFLEKGTGGVKMGQRLSFLLLFGPVPGCHPFVGASLDSVPHSRLTFAPMWCSLRA